MPRRFLVESLMSEVVQISITRKGSDLYKVVVISAREVINAYEAESLIVQRTIAEEMEEMKITPSLPR